MSQEPGSGPDHEGKIWGPQKPVNILPGQKGIVPEPGWADRFKEWYLNVKPVKRRKVLQAAGAATVAAVTGTGIGVLTTERTHQLTDNTTPTTENPLLEENTPGKDIVYLDKDKDDKYFLTNVAQYLELESLQTATNFAEGKAGFEPRLHDFSLVDTFDAETFGDQFRIVEATSQLPENVCVVRVGIKADNENPTRRIPDNDYKGNDIYVWLALADRNSPDPDHPIWVDENGNPVNDKIIVFSPIYGNTGPLKKKE